MDVGRSSGRYDPGVPTLLYPLFPWGVLQTSHSIRRRTRRVWWRVTVSRGTADGPCRTSSGRGRVSGVRPHSTQSLSRRIPVLPGTSLSRRVIRGSWGGPSPTGEVRRTVPSVPMLSSQTEGPVPTLPVLVPTRTSDGGPLPYPHPFVESGRPCGPRHVCTSGTRVRREGVTYRDPCPPGRSDL